MSALLAVAVLIAGSAAVGAALYAWTLFVAWAAREWVTRRA